MAIKLPDPGNGIPEQKTGNDEWTNMKIVRENFADQSNAASRLVGTATGNVPLVEQVRTALHSSLDGDKNSGDANDFDNGTFWYAGLSVANTPSGFSANRYNIETRYMGNGKKYQLALGWDKLSAAHRYRSGSSWSDWEPLGWDKKNYNTTSATAANVVVDSEGRLVRATSSLKYKDVIKDLEIDADLYEKAMGVNPIIFRSKSEMDPKDWHYMSFSAEELGELDPSLTQWLVKTHNDEGNELDEPVKEAEGINLNAICAVLHATNIYQDKKLKELEQRLKVLEQTDEPTI